MNRSRSLPVVDGVEIDIKQAMNETFLSDNSTHLTMLSDNYSNFTMANYDLQVVPVSRLGRHFVSS